MTKYHEHLDREWDILGWPKDGDDPPGVDLPASL